MAEYESIHGTRVRYLSSDPTLTDSSTEGQVWYNSTSGANKALVQIKSWSSGGNMGTARYLIGSCGAQDAALGFGGYSGSNKNQTEEYSGFTWRAGGNLNTARWGMGGAGSQTAGLAAGGFVSAASALTEEYDGSSWTAQNTMPTAMRDTTAAGTQTAAVTCGGSPPSGGVSGVTQEYDGTNWTTSPGSMSVARSTATAFGLQTAAIVAGGNEPGINSAEQYDGTNWTSINNLNSPVYSLASAANGTTSHGITFGGASPAGTGLTQTEEWDGNTWIISPASLASGKWKLGGAGTASAGLKFGGGPPPSGNVATEEYNSVLTSATAPSWTAGGNLGTGRYILAGGGTQTAGIVFAGFPTPNGATEEYNGASWTAGGNYPGAPKEALGGLGTQTATLGFGGYNPTPVQTATNEYNGSSWTAGGALNTAKRRCRGCGIQTAGVTAGGVTGGPNSTRTNATEEYDGSSWTTVNAMSGNSRRSNVLSGSQTASITIGGDNGPTTAVEDYNGTNWTTGTSLLLGQSSHSGDGTTSSAWTAGGAVSGTPSGITQIYNGTSWSLGTEMINARDQSGFSSSQSTSQGFVAGGGGAPIRNSTEEFDLGTAAVTTASTLTTS